MHAGGELLQDKMGDKSTHTGGKEPGCREQPGL
jgi:hypothetical protein